MKLGSIFFALVLLIYMCATPRGVLAVSIGNGDSNSDGQFNALDLKTVLSDFGKSLGLPVDQYTDGKINGFDFVTVSKRIAEHNPTAGGNPFGGVAWSVPGTIQAEDYDLGGEGVGYHDVDLGNSGNQYRTNEGVDVYTTNDGSGSSFDLQNVRTGEWLKYTVTVMTTGTYKLQLRAAGPGGTVHLEVDGVDVTGSLNIPTGVWQGYTKIDKDISLTAGTHVLKLVMDSADSGTGLVGNFNWMHFEQTMPLPVVDPVVVPVPGTEIFNVSPSGNDANPGTISAPWKTVAKAANTLTAGQTVYLRAGTYNERLVPKNSGSSGNYIIYSNYPGETVTLDGNGIVLPQLEGVVSFHSKRYIRVTGLRVINAGVGVANPKWNMGIFAKDSDHLVIDHNYVGHTYSLGIDLTLFTSYSLIDNNEVTDHFGDTESTVAMLWYSHHNVVSNNHVHHANGEGINTVAGAHHIKVHNNVVENIGPPTYLGSGVGIYSDAWTEHTHDNEYYNNISRNNGSGFVFSAEAGGLLENIKMFNNISYNNKLWGMLISKFPWDNNVGPNHPMKNISVINNTVYGNDIDSFGFPGISVENPQATGVVVTNNITSKGSSGRPIDQLKVDPGASATVTNNLIFGYAVTLGTNAVQADPLFVNAPAGNFHLQSTSPAINAGISTGSPSFDFDNNPRPNGNGYDVGAFEF